MQSLFPDKIKVIVKYSNYLENINWDYQ